MRLSPSCRVCGRSRGGVREVCTTSSPVRCVPGNGSFSGKGVRECFRRSGKENVCRASVPLAEKFWQNGSWMWKKARQRMCRRRFPGRSSLPGNGEKEREKGVQDAKKGGRISFPLLQRVPDSEHGGRHGMTAFFMSAARLPEGSPVRKKKSGNGLAPFPPSSPRRTKGYFQLSMLQCFTRSRSSAALPSLKRSRVPTR